MLRFALAVVMALALAGCASLSVPGANALRNLDYANDDVASLLIAFDMPETIEPMPSGPALQLAVASASGESRNLRAALVRSDAGELAGTLPPPGDGRVYYLFGFSDADQRTIREIQVWARTQPQGRGGSMSLALEPNFCAVEAVDPGKVRFSVLIALPGAPALAPLVRDQSLAAALQAMGATLPACGGHSG